MDYMAEAIIKSAKIKESMSDDEKVRRIYHWMTAHQKHTHYSEGGKFKKYYKLASSKKKIQKYKKANDMKLKQGSLIYNYDSKWNAESENVRIMRKFLKFYATMSALSLKSAAASI